MRGFAASVLLLLIASPAGFAKCNMVDAASMVQRAQREGSKIDSGAIDHQAYMRRKYPDSTKKGRLCSLASNQLARRRSLDFELAQLNACFRQMGYPISPVVPMSNEIYIELRDLCDWE